MEKSRRLILVSGFFYYSVSLKLGVILKTGVQRQNVSGLESERCLNLPIEALIHLKPLFY